MTRSQRLAAIAVGAVLLVGIPVAGAHQAPPPDLGDPVVVGRTGSAPAHSTVPSGEGAAEHAPTRSPSPDATARPSDADEEADAVDLAPTTTPPDDEDTDDRTPTAKPVPANPPVPAGVVSDDDPTPTPTAPTTSGTPSTPASDDGDDGDDDGAGGDD